MPSLSMMTQAAIQLLEKNPNGYALMVKLNTKNKDFHHIFMGALRLKVVILTKLITEATPVKL